MAMQYHRDSPPAKVTPPSSFSKAPLTPPPTDSKPTKLVLKILRLIRQCNGGRPVEAMSDPSAQLGLEMLKILTFRLLVWDPALSLTNLHCLSILYLTCNAPPMPTIRALDPATTTHTVDS
jgi:hypothetical protein